MKTLQQISTDLENLQYQLVIQENEQIDTLKTFYADLSARIDELDRFARKLYGMIKSKGKIEL